MQRFNFRGQLLTVKENCPEASYIPQLYINDRTSLQGCESIHFSYVMGQTPAMYMLTTDSFIFF